MLFLMVLFSTNAGCEITCSGSQDGTICKNVLPLKMNLVFVLFVFFQSFSGLQGTAQQTLWQHIITLESSYGKCVDKTQVSNSSPNLHSAGFCPPAKPEGNKRLFLDAK